MEGSQCIPLDTWGDQANFKMANETLATPLATTLVTCRSNFLFQSSSEIPEQGMVSDNPILLSFRCTGLKLGFHTPTHLRADLNNIYMTEKPPATNEPVKPVHVRIGCR